MVRVDGELVVLDDDGRSNFNKLMFSRTGSHYFAFDLLMLDSTDLRASPLESRKERLRALFSGNTDPVRYCDNVERRGKDFFEVVRETGLEGMVAKRKRSPYLGRLTDDWLKVKCLRNRDFIIGGWLSDEHGVRGLDINRMARENFLWDASRESDIVDFATVTLVHAEIQDNLTPANRKERGRIGLGGALEGARILFLSDGEDRARGAAQHFLGDARFDEPRQPAPAVRDHHDQVGGQLCCDLGDNVRRLTHLV